MVIYKAISAKEEVKCAGKYLAGESRKVFVKVAFNLSILHPTPSISCVRSKQVFVGGDDDSSFKT